MRKIVYNAGTIIVKKPSILDHFRKTEQLYEKDDIKFILTKRKPVTLDLCKELLD